ncbi:hypothetical protein M3588_25590 [Cytobacillus sp. AMY 15.2]|uniref:hypothetical protein n=1 Tax=Cytobacillus sp. AMY 15.2 TaxID=2939563 RepID=UPI0020413B5C|nr:hypothetical protein [Cytobacillus sp. AMY 15.2]MCM3094370.1 hypothetical protein [Cytobacillus sp. AMY 15.2]
MKKKLLSITLAFAITLSGAAALPTGASAASNLSSNLGIVEISTSLIKTEVAAFDEFQKATWENINIGTKKAGEMNKFQIELAEIQKLAKVKDAEVNLERAKAEFNQLRTKNPQLAKQKLDEAHRKFEQARVRAGEEFKLQAQKIQTDFARERSKIKSMTSQNDKVMKDKGTKVRKTTGVEEVQNAIVLVNEYKNNKVDSIQDYAVAEKETNKISAQILEREYFINKLDTEIMKIKNNLSDKGYRAKMDALNKEYQLQSIKLQDQYAKIRVNENQRYQAVNKRAQDSISLLKLRLKTISK